jgi:hypothetical protein
MDLTHLNSAEVYLYDDRNVVTETFIYPYPIVTGVTDIGQHELQIIQQNFGEIIVNRGRIAIDLTEDMTSNMIGGNIYSEIKFAIMDTTYVIGCLLLGKIMPSRINQYSLEI